MADETVAHREAKFFKGGKSKAIKGLRRYLADTNTEFSDRELNHLLFQHGEDCTWGFDPDAADDAVNAKKALANKIEAELEKAEQVQAGPEDNPRDDEQEEEPEEHNPVAAAGAFGSMGNSLERQPVISPAPSPAPQREKRSNYTIEKNRPEQNGIKRPSAGGKCREVWDECDQMRDAMNGGTPTSEMIRKLSEDKGWNKNNTMIEFYQWRKFNGITGRAGK